MDSCAENNISNYERTFRGVLGTGMLTAVIGGVVTSPVTIFSILIAVHLIMTATLGSDPIYEATHARNSASPRGRDCSSTAAFRRGRASSRTARPAQSGRW